MGHTPKSKEGGQKIIIHKLILLSLDNFYLKILKQLIIKMKVMKLMDLIILRFFFIHTQDSKHSIFLKLFVITSFRFCNNVFLKIESWQWTRLYSVDTVVFSGHGCILLERVPFQKSREAILLRLL